MKTIIEFDNQKATQAINLLAIKEGGKIDKLKVIKLIWIADRLHLRKYGRPIVNDTYLAMEYGAVGSSVKDFASFNVEEGEAKYLKEYLEPINKYNIKSKKQVDTDVFSDSEIEMLEKSYNEYGFMDKFTLAKLSHEFPEWKKFKEALKVSTREVMSYEDFFKNPDSDIPYKNIFNESKEELIRAKETFADNYAVASFWF